MANKEKSRFTTLIGKEMRIVTDNINKRMGVYILVSHLLITMSIIVLYGLMMFLEKDTTVIEGLLFAIVGYWFGAISKDSLKSAEKITDVVDRNSNSVNTETVTTETIVRENNRNENI